MPFSLLRAAKKDFGETDMSVSHDVNVDPGERQCFGIKTPKPGSCAGARSSASILVFSHSPYRNSRSLGVCNRPAPKLILKTGALPSVVRRFGDHLDQDARNVGCSDPSSTENSTGIISFVVTLPFKSFSTTTSCWAPSRPTGITILPPALS